MQVILITDSSVRSYELMNKLDELGIDYELQKSNRHDLPILKVDDKEMNYAKALRWIRKRGDRSGDFI